MSLLSSIWDGIRGWVQDLIASAIANIRQVINYVYTSFYTFVTNTYNYITQAIQNIYNTIVQYVTNTYNYITQAITNVYNTVAQYVSNTYQYVTQNITNVVNNTVQYVTNVVGASTEWVTAQIAAVDTVGFFKDPLGYLRAAFDQFIAYYVFSAAEGFAKGLEAGLPLESPPKEKPDAAFERGFMAALDEEGA